MTSLSLPSKHFAVSQKKKSPCKAASSRRVITSVDNQSSN